MNIELEKGSVLEVSDILVITKNYTVMYHGIPVGSAKDHLSWFHDNPKKIRHDEIKQVAYLGNYTWGVREFTQPIEEFESLDASTRSEILINLLNVQEKIIKLKGEIPLDQWEL
jgi:hypothetical protein